jgi:carotenoid cleavage dioxygenase
MFRFLDATALDPVPYRRRLDVTTGAVEEEPLSDGVSEAQLAPRAGATAEDDGYVVTITTDVAADHSECLVFAAADLSAGPVASVRLPERVCSGTHSCWTPH